MSLNVSDYPASLSACPKVLFEDVGELGEDSPCKAFTPVLLKDRCPPRFVCCFVADGFIFWDVLSCPRNLSRAVPWNANSCRYLLLSCHASTLAYPDGLRHSSRR